MIQVEALSDVQLRAKLVAQGLPTMPVTLTTCQTIIKKLERFDANRRTMASFSSDNDSDTQNSSSGSHRRRTRACNNNLQPARHLAADDTISDLELEADEDEENSLSISLLDVDTSGSPPRQFTSSRRTSLYRPVPMLPTIPPHGFLVHDEATLGRTSTPYLRNFAKRAAPSPPRPPSQGVAARAHAQLQRQYARACSWVARRRSTVRWRSPLPAIGHSSNVVSLALLAAVAAFFLLLVALYCGLQHDAAIGPQMALCDACLTREEAQGARDLYAIVRPQLVARAVAQACAHPAAPSGGWYMTDADVVAFVARAYKVPNIDELRADVRRMALLAQQTPAAGDVVVLRVPPDGALQWRDAANAIAQRHEMAPSERAFAVLAPPLPLSCALRMRLQAALTCAIWLTLAAILCYAVRAIACGVRDRRRRQRHAVLQLVERIVEAAADGAPGYCVVNHLRDALIPIQDRASLDGAWKAAVRYVSAHESRVRTEVQLVRGESCEVWRWVGVPKAWQGQAFEQHAGGVNAPPCSPTACLKVRGMLDDGDAQQAAADALLARCGAECRVLHVGVDAHSKCVYVKCADTADAAVAYRQLHGQWYAGHLVTVKYLRLERYMQRFPESAQRGPPYLRPNDAPT